MLIIQSFGNKNIYRSAINACIFMQKISVHTLTNVTKIGSFNTELLLIRHIWLMHNVSKVC